MTLFMRATGERDKHKALSHSARELREGSNSSILFEVDTDEFRSIPGSPFAYWVSQNVRQVFERFESYESEDRLALHGASSKDDFRFLRLWWESDCSQPQARWTLFSKGGIQSAFYMDIQLLINWHEDAREIEAAALHKYPYLGDNANWLLHRESPFYEPILYQTLRASRLCLYLTPKGCIFGDNGFQVYCDQEDLLSFLGLLNSNVSDKLFKLMLGRAGFAIYRNGLMRRFPIPTSEKIRDSNLAELARRAWSLRRTLDTVDETSHAFSLPTALRARLGEYVPTAINAALNRIQSELDEIAFALYDLDESDRDSILGDCIDVDEIDSTENGADEHDEGSQEVSAEALASLLAWCVGVAFGRLDWRLATGDRDGSPEPDPFDPLPAKSPGMLPDGDEPFHQNSGILVDDPGHPHDLVGLVESVLEQVDVSTPSDVRRWLQRDFFKEHLSQYSKSRRKAPIYWPLSTPSGIYTLWVYYPALTSQTLYTAVNDFLEPKLKEVADNAQALRSKSDRSAKEEKEFAQLQDLEIELKELREAILEIAKDYEPNHDDGVQITAAPLWPLFQHRPWQKVLKDTWKKLEKGEYDWAHLAMNYWPDRVRAKCKKDMSLAIAHDSTSQHE